MDSMELFNDLTPYAGTLPVQEGPIADQDHGVDASGPVSRSIPTHYTVVLGDPNHKLVKIKALSINYEC
jgi:hypothetical protein